MAQVPAKIVLKSTTRMSLNDRFTNIQKSRPAVSVQNIRAKMAAQQQASVRNRRLAQQMANRPSVIAALKIKRRSLKQRLGKSNVKSRLSLSVMRGRGGRGSSRGGRFRGRGINLSMRGMPGRMRGSSLSRQHSALSLGGGGPGNMEDGRNMSMLRGRGRGGGRFRGGRGGGFRGGRGIRGRGGNIGGGPYMKSRSNRFNRGAPNRKWGRGGGGRNKNIDEIKPPMNNMLGHEHWPQWSFPGMLDQGPPRSRFRGGRGGPRSRGSGRGGNRFRGGRGPPRGMRGSRGRGGPPGIGGGGLGGNPGSGGNPHLNKQELDNQLDEYMSKTKAHLDAELDAYMAQANEQS